MLWIFERQGEHMRCEIRREGNGAGYEMVVTHPDGSERMERFDDTTDLIKRTLESAARIARNRLAAADALNALETDLRGLPRRLRRFEQRIILETEDLGGDDARKLAPARVVLLHALVVAHPFDRDAVLGAR